MTSSIPAKKRLEDPEPLVREALKKLLQDIQSPVPPETVWPQVSSTPTFRELIIRWDRWTAQDRRKGWEKMSRILEQAAYATRPYCLRCGTCCRKGSPSLYRDDLPLIRAGIIRRIDLLTLRSGEIGFSNEKNCLVEIAQEQIKIREKPRSRECLFFNPGDSGCAIYTNRPLQCRILECWHPEQFKKLSNNKLLSRKYLLNTEDPLWPVIRSHEERCGFTRIKEALRQDAEGGDKEGKSLMEIIDYDFQVRDFLIEKFSLHADHLEFILGRKVTDFLSSLGIRIR